MTDAEALARYARQGDPEAFSVLVRRHQSAVLATCRRRLGHGPDAEDATQEVFVKLARSAGGIRRHLDAWLHRVALSRCVDHARSEAARRRREHATAQPEGSDGDAGDASAWAEVEAELDAALDALPAARRDLIVQRYFAGRGLDDLATETGVNKSTVKRRLDAALATLRDRLAKRGVALSLGGLTSGLAASSAAAATAVPPSLTASLTKIGVAGVGAPASASPLATLPGALVMSVAAHPKTSIGLGAAALLAAGLTVVAWLAPGQAPVAPTATNGAATTNDELPDPALAGAWEMQRIEAEGRTLGMRVDGEFMEVDSIHPQSGGIGMTTFRITHLDHEADPPEWDMEVVRAAPRSTVAPEGTRFEVIYRVNEPWMMLTIGQEGERPEAFHGRRLRRASREVDFVANPRLNRAAEAPHPGIDPDVIGTWTVVENGAWRYDLEPGWVLVSDDAGDIVMEMEVTQWNTDAEPKRIEYVIHEHPSEQHIGRTVRHIYEVREGGGVRSSAYPAFSPKQNQWPADFTGRDGALVYHWGRVGE